MVPWTIFHDLGDACSLFSTDFDLYTCTPNAWPSISKLVSLLHEEPLASQVKECSGLIKGYVSCKDLSFVWFHHHQTSGPNEIEFNQGLEGRTMVHNNILHWFCMPTIYRRVALSYVEAKSLQSGMVPFMWKITGNGVATHSLTHVESPLQSNRQLFLVTSESTDLIFYCVQSLCISEENLVRRGEGNNIENFTLIGFPHHPFSSINVLESCNIEDEYVQIHSRSTGPNAVTCNDDPKSLISSSYTDQFVCEEVTIKEELDLNCELEAKHEMQQDRAPCHENLPVLRPVGRKGLNCDGKEVIDFKNILRSSKRYVELASAKERRHSKLGGFSKRIHQPSFIIECPGCARLYPPGPDSLYKMLLHLRTKHKRHCDKLLSIASESLAAVIAFMQNRIDVWSKKSRFKPHQVQK